LAFHIRNKDYMSLWMAFCEWALEAWSASHWPGW
jgi:hypothetical protein